MTVAYVLKTYPRLSQTFIVNEILAHEAQGLPLQIFALRRPKAEDLQADVSAVRAPVNYLDPASLTLQAAELAAAVRQHGITHLHAHFGNSAAEVARLAARQAGIGYSFTAHARDIFLDSVDGAALARRLQDARAVVTVSDFNLRHLRHHYGPAADQVNRIYNGLDLTRLVDRPALPREPLILAVGRLIEKKGFADLVDACALLRDRGQPWRCVIVGSGPLEADLRARIERLGLQGQVQLTGALPPGDVAAWMQRAAVFAAPCVVGADGDRDGLPTVLLEAMALGSPCVSTDVTGIPEIVRDGDTGLCVPQHDPAALAGALARLLHDAPLRDQLARRARQLIEQAFDIHRNTACMRRLFEAPHPHGQPGRPDQPGGSRPAAANAPAALELR